MAKDKKKPLISTFKISFVIIAIILVPLVMDQLDLNKEDVKVVGRVCGGIAGLFMIYGVFTKILKVFAFILLAIVALAVLISENVIEAPRLMEYFS